MTFVIAGGGTSGHVLPALAIAEALEDAGHRANDVHYVGAARGVEARLLPATPYDYTLLAVDGLQRGFSPSGLRRNLVFAPRLAMATRQAIGLVRRLEARVVVSVGGYASMPAALAARWCKVPVVVVTYDRRPGRASALTARFAAATAAAYPGSPLPRAEVTGAPVRRVIKDVDRDGGRAAARRELGIAEDRFLVAVLGGSLGSGVLNAAIAEYVAQHRDDPGLAVFHVAGERFYDDVAASAPPLHHVVAYEERIDRVYAAADLLIGRGGASTVAEVAVTGTPAILVPWAGAAENHQVDNVRWLADDDACVMLAESETSRLAAVIEELRGDPARRARLAAAAHQRGDLHRGDRLAAMIERVAAVPGHNARGPHSASRSHR